MVRVFESNIIFPSACHATSNISMECGDFAMACHGLHNLVYCFYSRCSALHRCCRSFYEFAGTGEFTGMNKILGDVVFAGQGSYVCVCVGRGGGGGGRLRVSCSKLTMLLVNVLLKL